MTLADPVLRLLGLAARAGAVVPGTERVREAARDGSLRFAFVAADASANTCGKLLPLLTARGVSHVKRYERVELGAAIGRAPLGAVGVLEPGFAARFSRMLALR